MTQEPFSNSRRRRQETDKKYLVLTLFGLVVVGGGLIALIYGLPGLLTALPCLLGGAGLILVPWWLLTALETWRRRADEADYDE